MSGNLALSLDSLIIFVLLLMYVVGGSFMEHKKLIFGHETGIALIVGLFISLGLHFFGDGHYQITFDGGVFFYVCLPPIIFASGFNMRRKRFFNNIGYILLFGIFGTIVTFFVFFGLTYGITSTNSLQYYYKSEWYHFTLQISECFVISSLLCSSDVIAAISIIKYDDQPKLFSLVFGEGIVNDAVAIILFNTVSQAIKNGVDYTTPLEIVGNFLLLGFGSVGFGILYGLLGSYILKRCRFIAVSSIKETLLIFCFGYIAYSTGELVHLSGIISLLTSGIIMAHYGWYNLSPQGKHVSCVAFQVIGFGFEAFVFAYLGLSFFSYASSDFAWSWSFILVEMGICIVARICGTVGLLYLLVLLRHKAGVTLKQVMFISYAGMIRGAIAFGLVLQLNSDLIADNTIRSLITTSALTLVVSTTIIFGSFMPIVQKFLVPPLEQEKHEYDPAVENVDSEGTADFDEDQKKKPLIPNKAESGAKAEQKKDTSNNKINVSKHAGEEHEEFIHPNAMRQSEYEESVNNRLDRMTKSEFIKTRKKKKNSCASCFVRFDEIIVKPIFIYKYEWEQLNKKEEFLELFMKEADIWEKMYQKEEFNPQEVEETRSVRGMSVFRHIETMSRKNSVQHMQRNSVRNSGISITTKPPNLGPRSPGLPRALSPAMMNREVRSHSSQIVRRRNLKNASLPNENLMGNIGIVVEENVEEEFRDEEKV